MLIPKVVSVTKTLSKSEIYTISKYINVNIKLQYRFNYSNDHSNLMDYDKRIIDLKHVKPPNMIVRSNL